MNKQWKQQGIAQRQGLDKVIRDYLENVTIADLMEYGDSGDAYVI